MAALRAAFDRWLDAPDGTAFSTLFDTVTAELASSLGGAS